MTGFATYVCGACGTELPAAAVYREQHEAASCPALPACPRCLATDRGRPEWPCTVLVHPWHAWRPGPEGAAA